MADAVPAGSGIRRLFKLETEREQRPDERTALNAGTVSVDNAFKECRGEGAVITRGGYRVQKRNALCCFN